MSATLSAAYCLAEARQSRAMVIAELRHARAYALDPFFDNDERTRAERIFASLTRAKSYRDGASEWMRMAAESAAMEALVVVPVRSGAANQNALTGQSLRPSSRRPGPGVSR